MDALPTRPRQIAREDETHGVHLDKLHEVLLLHRDVSRCNPGKGCGIEEKMLTHKGCSEARTMEPFPSGEAKRPWVIPQRDVDAVRSRKPAAKDFHRLPRVFNEPALKGA